MKKALLLLFLSSYAFPMSIEFHQCKNDNINYVSLIQELFEAAFTEKAMDSWLVSFGEMTTIYLTFAKFCAHCTIDKERKNIYVKCTSTKNALNEQKLIDTMEKKMEYSFFTCGLLEDKGSKNE